MPSYKKVVCTKLGTNFTECTEVVSAPLEAPKPKQVQVRMSALGINASDINFTSGHYSGGNIKTPFDCGFEGVGVVTAVGEQAKQKFSVGDAVVVQSAFCGVTRSFPSAWFPL